MLVQVLAEYADHYLADQLNDAAWESKPVPWLIELSPEGTFLSITERTTSEPRGKKTVTLARQLVIPRSPVKRNSGEHPLLAADDIAYVLGPGAWTTDKKAERDKSERHNRAFVALIAKAAEETQDTALAACVRFYERSDEVEKARAALAKAKAGVLVALSVNGPVVDRESVHGWWRAHYERERAADVGDNIGECIISGEVGPIAPTHASIKGVSNLGGQASGVALMSFDKQAFRSYGWEQNANSPVSPDRAMAYVLALNDLLRQGGSASKVAGQFGKVRRSDKAGVGFVYWTRDPSNFDLFARLDPQDESSVGAILNLEDVAVDANQFYLVGLSGNGGRLRVRCWVTDSLGHIQRNIVQWREQLRVAWPWEAPFPVRLWQLQYAIEREGKPPAADEIALLRRALEGRAQPLGYSILAKALHRLRHPAKDNRGEKMSKEAHPLQELRVPVGLVRLCINDLRSQRKEMEMSEGLDRNCTLPAYLCGRLMYEYEYLQWKASGNVNSSVTDRYFSLASTYPAVAMPKIVELGQAHMRKLRRDKPGAAHYIDNELQDIHAKLPPSDSGPYPRSLNLEKQGLFILGYYHQKADAAIKAQAAKQSNNQNDSAATGESEEN